MEARVMVFVSLGLSMLSGCASVYQPGSIAQDWACKLRELQIQPLFPPREDVQVGDVYLLAMPKDGTTSAGCESRQALGASFPANGTGFVPIGKYLSDLGVGNAVNAHYSTRLDLPKTEASTLSVGTDGKIEISGYATSASTEIIPAPETPPKGTLKRLRIVGFPDFMTVKVSGAELGAIAPVLGMPSEIALSADAVESASLSIPVAESYAIPALTILPTLKEHFHSSGSACKVNYDDVKTMFSEDTLEKNDLVLHAIYEVYYTRALSAELSLKQDFAMGVNRDRSSAKGKTSQQVLPQPEAAETGTANGTQVDKASNNGTATAQDAVRNELAERVQSAADALAKRKGLPGVTLDVHSGSASNIGMTRVFERPIAIGFRSISFKVQRDQKNNCLVFAQASSENVPVPASGNVGD